MTPRAVATEPHVTSRTLYAVSAVFLQVLLGVLYSWSVFRGPLAQAHNWTQAQTIAPYRYSLLAFAFGMIVAGFWQDRVGPRLVASIGGILLSLGCLVAGLNADSLNGLITGYGIIAGIGVGFAYVTPIAMCIKWYPDKRGFIVGLAVMGFGVGPLLFGPLIEWLIGSDPAAFTQTIPKTFFVLAALFLVGVTGAAQFYRVPPAGWRPPNWNAQAATSAVARRELAPGATLSTWQFYALWLLYFLGTSVGLTAIGEASPLLRQMAAKGGAPITAGTALGIMSIFNGAGRLGWGAVSDRMGRKAAVLGMCAGSVIACLAFLRAPAGFTPLLAGLCLAAFCYGGYLALMPSFTADFFGPKHVGANYGLLFTAWGICGFVIPGYFAGIMDRARTAGNLQSGYDEVYFTLAALSLAGAAVCAILRPPQNAS